MDNQQAGPSQPKEMKKSKRKEEPINACPPFFPECEVFLEGGTDAKQRFALCTKNPGHANFIPVNTFKIDHLPPECRNEKFMRGIKECCDRTVKISVKYTSHNRPDTHPNSTAPYPYSGLKGSKRAVRCGTGVIYYVRPSKIKGKPCPCHVCKESGSPVMEFAKVEVFTAAHVVFDDFEAQCTVCEVFYDSKDRDSVKYLYGVKGVKNGSGDCTDNIDNGAGMMERCNGDKYFIQCVTHDMEFFEVLQRDMPGIYSQFYGLSPLKFIVSHPHGWSKHIAFGEIKHYTILPPPDISLDSPFVISTGAMCKRRSCLGTLIYYPKLFTEVRNFYKLKKELNVHFPHDAPFLGQTFVVEEDCSNNISIDWIKFPKGTKFTSSDREEPFSLPGTSFCIAHLENILDGKYAPYFMTYDIATCEGSSGAQIVADNHSVSGLDWATHFGSLTNGRNRSGINKHFHSGAIINRELGFWENCSVM